MKANELLTQFLVLTQKDQETVQAFITQFKFTNKGDPISADPRRHTIVGALLIVLSSHQLRMSEQRLIDTIERKKLWKHIDAFADTVYSLSDNGQIRNTSIYLVNLVVEDCKKKSQPRGISNKVLDRIKSPTIRKAVGDFRLDPIPFNVVRVIQRLSAIDEILANSFPGYSKELLKQFVLR